METMTDTYFSRVAAQTGTRFWVNNPTAQELELALTNGAAGCTTNPAYGGNLAKRAPDEIRSIVMECLSISGDDRVVADHVQERLVARIAERLAPLHAASQGRAGFVSIQGSPETDMDTETILEEAQAGRRIGPNVAPKIPATAPGLKAVDALVAEDSPIIVTEVFSLAQLIETCERWLAAANAAGVRPPFYVSPITGILGDHLKKVAARDGIDVPAQAMELAGVVLARRCFEVVVERAYPVTLLFGGARTQVDFTALVGGGMAATINWSTAEELLELEVDPAKVETIREAPDPEVAELLSRSFEDVRRALDPEALPEDEFANFGPVQHFRDAFLAGWNGVLSLIADARVEAIVAAG
ncbi:MAG: hypothetical protein H0U86_18535 [Chloroflexi bacterium]|nr:hypothetical protein [Chloroflexota bacterium]